MGSSGDDLIGECFIESRTSSTVTYEKVAKDEVARIFSRDLTLGLMVSPACILAILSLKTNEVLC